MKKTIRKVSIHPRSEKMGPPIGYFSYGLVVEEGIPLFLAGVVSRDPQNRVVGKGDMKVQIRQTLERIEILLREVGAGLDSVVRTTIHTTDIEEYLRVSEGVWEEYFKKDPPASTLIGVKRLADPAVLVEIEATAIIPRQAS